MRRRKLSNRQNRRTFNRGNKVNKRNIRTPVVQRGGYRI